MKKTLIISFVALIAVSLFAISVKPDVFISADELEYPIDDEGEDSYVYVSDCVCKLSISSGTATVSTEVKGKSGTTSTNVTVYLEKFVAGSWQPYTSWSHSGGKDQNNSDSTSVTSGAYRVWMSVTASGTGGSESFNVDGNTAGC